MLYFTYALIACAAWVFCGAVYMIVTHPNLLSELQQSRAELERFEQERTTPKYGVMAQLKSADDSAEFARLKSKVRDLMLELIFFFGPILALLACMSWIVGTCRLIFGARICQD